jgi:protein-disulfide isomerase
MLRAHADRLMRSYFPFIIVLFVLVAAIACAPSVFKSGQNPGPSNPVPTNSPSTSPDPKSSGTLPADAVVTLEEFGDYQCPPCAALHPTLKKLKQEFGANLNFVFRNLPLTQIHKNALAAAQAAEAARMQDHFWEMHDFLYENQELWRDDINPQAIFVKQAADLGLDTARFRRDMGDKQVQLRIEADADAAAKLSVQGTPTIFIEGLELRPEVTNPDGIRKGIEQMMARKASPSR